jgi:tRNA 2-thiouridine synthesizing protein A
MSDDHPIIVVDARGHRCPVPTLRLRKALSSAPMGGLVKLLTDDPMARIDVPLFVREAGHELVIVEAVDGMVLFTVRITESVVGK